MALTVAQILPTLWPRASYTPWFVAGARNRAISTYGKAPDGTVYDVGALRDSQSGAEVLTPPGWVRYDPVDHHYIASVHNRLGPGWSWGSNSVHNSGRGWFRDIYRREPKPMENIDVQFNKALYEHLRRIAVDGSAEPPPVFDSFDSTPPRPKPPATPPVSQPQPQPPKPTPVPSPPIPAPTPVPISSSTLTPASTRVEELRQLARQFNLLPFSNQLLDPQTWALIKPLAVDLLRTYRLIRKHAGGDSREIPPEDK